MVTVLLVSAVVILLVIVAVVALWVFSLARSPEFWKQSAQVEVDLHRVRRSMEATQIKHEIRSTGRQLRRELRRELEELE